MNAIPKPSSDNHASPLRESLSSPFKALALILLYLLFFANPAAAQEFTDIAGYWGEPYIKALVEHGIVAGFPDGSFKPNEQVTRAQFAAMVTRAFELEEEGSQSAASFSDVSNKYWGSKAIAAVSSAGLVSGFPDGTFHPEERITRAQALVILAKTLPQAEIIKAERIGKEALARYTDADA